MSFQLIGVTPTVHTDKLWEVIPALFQAGLSYLYIRQTESEELRQHLADEALQPYQAQLILPFAMPKSHYRLHWKESIRQQTQPGSQAFSTSIHQIDLWPTLTGRVELVFYSPLFPSISKPGYSPALTLEEQTRRIEELRRQPGSLPKLIGLGGIQANTIVRVQEAGFDGAAVLGTLWESPDPVKTVEELVKQIA